MAVGIADKPAPKMLLPGTLERRFVRCGKANCRCANGELHGPYYRRVYWSDGKRKRRYVPLPAIADCLAGVALWQAEREQRRKRRREIRAVRRQLQVFSRLLRGFTGHR